jgi:ribosomal protein S27E
MNREAWLNALAKQMRPMFSEAGAEIPTNIRITCGWPSKGALARKSQRIGEAWYGEASADQHGEIFISPILSNTERVADVLAHELIHLAVGKEAGHKKPFKRVADAIGLEGKMTATYGGEAFKVNVKPMLEALGDYPHAELNAMAPAHKKQTTRLLKVQCPECGYVARVTRQWLESAGAPICPIHGEAMIEPTGDEE